MTEPGQNSPFLVEHLRLPDTSHSARYIPAARLVLLPALRTSGLLQTLPGEEIKTLLALLTFLTANGHVSTTLPEIAQALGTNEGKARARLERLLTFVWHGEPLVREVSRELGLDAYVPSPRLFMQEEQFEREQQEQAHEQQRREAETKARLGPTVRDAIYAQNRALYAKPRAEVEREVMRLMGHAPEEADDTPEGEVRRRLSRLDISTDEADQLIATFPLHHIKNQIDWLPYRNAKSPARFVVAAIENHYDPPLFIMRERRVVQAKPSQSTDTVFVPEENQNGVYLPLPEASDSVTG